MSRVEPEDFRRLNVLKHYRLIRKWAARNNNLQEADLELLIYLDCLGHFSKKDYQDGTLAYSWDKRRWDRLLKEKWIYVWRERNRTTRMYNAYKVSIKGKHLISKIYRIMLGQDEIPKTKRSNKIMRGETYTDKGLRTAIKRMD